MAIFATHYKVVLTFGSEDEIQFLRVTTLMKAAEQYFLMVLMVLFALQFSKQISPLLFIYI